MVFLFLWRSGLAKINIFGELIKIVKIVKRDITAE